MARQQNAGNENRGKVAVFRPEPMLRPVWRPRRNRPAGGSAYLRVHAASLILCTWLAAGLFTVCTLPDGQRTTTFSIFATLPRPKCNRRWFCAQKPLPPETSCTCSWPFQNSVTSAPIALRLLVVPSSSNSIHWFSGVTVFL